MSEKALLMILDGWGNATRKEASAVDQAHTPFIDSLYEDYAYSTLRTDGEHVGLPKGQMGNSEVGHMNLGAGRIVYQDFARINTVVEEGKLKEQAGLQKAIAYAKQNEKPIHILGLLSDGGVHAHINHYEAMITALATSEVPFIFTPSAMVGMLLRNQGQVLSSNSTGFWMKRQGNWPVLLVATMQWTETSAGNASKKPTNF